MSYQELAAIKGYIETLRIDFNKRLDSLVEYVDQILSQQRGDVIGTIEPQSSSGSSSQDDLQILRESERNWNDVQEARQKLLKGRRKGSG